LILLERLSVDRFKGLRDVALVFPERGSVLVEGLNEAGKSTLFESVYFALYGSLLASEENRGGLESAIGYGAAEARVELAFRVGDTRLEVTRTIRRGKPSRARLRLILPDASEEEVGQIAAINRRITQEMGDLEGAALLDSCFVEQKKLEKLEAMDAREREAALLRLLNLDRLASLERRFRSGRADERALQAREARAELAAVRDAIPAREAEEAAATLALRAAALRRDLDALAQHEAEAEAARAECRRLDAARVEQWAAEAATTERTLLREWERLETTAAGAADLAAAEQAATAAQARLAAREAVVQARGGQVLGGAGAAAPLLLAGAAAFAFGQAGLGAGLGALGLVVAIAVVWLGRGWAAGRAALGSARHEAAAAAEAVATARAEAQLAARLGIDEADRFDLAAQFHVLGTVPPESLAECRARLRDLTPPAPLPYEGRGEPIPPGPVTASVHGGRSRGSEPPAPPSLIGKGAGGLGSLGAVERALGEAAARATAAEAQAAERRDAVVDALTALDVPPPEALTVEAVARLVPAVAEGAAPADEIARRRDALLADLGALRNRQAALEAQWGLADTPLDRAACEAEAAALRRDLAVRARATSIITTARDRLVQRVLPNTVRHMQLLLPLLTAGRYRDAAITEDYRIRVWDERAGRYVAKHLFSGGTRDQFSLALRLAFALATLPAERGARPGFLFLDEPLSAFDAPRARALVELLTTGYVAQHFAQVFVISHGGPFDRHAFPYTIRLANGRVVETNLPTNPAAAPAASPPLASPAL
jgi:ABC-type Mn2+/Zn2+ transport system ATPase subunit